MCKHKRPRPGRYTNLNVGESDTRLPTKITTHPSTPLLHILRTLNLSVFNLLQLHLWSAPSPSSSDSTTLLVRTLFQIYKRKKVRRRQSRMTRSQLFHISITPVPRQPDHFFVDQNLILFSSFFSPLSFGV